MANFKKIFLSYFKKMLMKALKEILTDSLSLSK